LCKTVPIKNMPLRFLHIFPIIASSFYCT
jgi:hypothetical protein